MCRAATLARPPNAAGRISSSRAHHRPRPIESARPPHCNATWDSSNVRPFCPPLLQLSHHSFFLWCSFTCQVCSSMLAQHIVNVVQTDAAVRHNAGQVRHRPRRGTGTASAAARNVCCSRLKSRHRGARPAPTGCA